MISLKKESALTALSDISEIAVCESFNRLINSTIVSKSVIKRVYESVLV
jgi:hypothetical protein